MRLRRLLSDERDDFQLQIGGLFFKDRFVQKFVQPDSTCSRRLAYWDQKIAAQYRRGVQDAADRIVGADCAGNGIGFDGLCPRSKRCFKTLELEFEVKEGTPIRRRKVSGAGFAMRFSLRTVCIKSAWAS